jgi:hypothetical protein
MNSAVKIISPLNLKKMGNYSAAIHQDGEKFVLFVPYFFRELLGFLLNWRKQRPEGLKPFARSSAKSLRISHPKKSKCHFTKGPFCH